VREEEMDEGDNDEESEENKRQEVRDNQVELSISKKRNEECENDENDENEEKEIKVVIKEEHDDDFISVDVELSEGGNVTLASPCRVIEGDGVGEGEICNNNEQPKDLSSGKIQIEPSEVEEESSLKKKKDDEYENDDNNKKETPISTIIHSKSRHLPQLDQQQLLKQQQQHRHQREGSGGGRESNSSSPSVSPRSSPGLSPSHPYDFSGAPSMVSRFHPFFEHPFMAYRHFNSFNFGQSFPVSNGPEGHSQSGYEAALGLVSRNNKGGSGNNHPHQGKPSGLEVFHDFQNGVPASILQSNRGSSGGSMMASGGGGDHHHSRIRGEDLFSSSRSASSAELISSIINSNRGDLGLSPLNLGSHHHHHQNHPNSLAMDERRKRNRTFIDPVTEVPRLEQW
jgi:hypothetical protein